MGNARSKSRGDILNEYDEAYFDRLAEKFNTTTSSASTSSKSNKLFGCFSVTKKIKEGDVTTIGITNNTKSKVHDAIKAENRAEPLLLPSTIASPRYVLPAPGPLQIHTTLKIPTPNNKKSKRRRKRRQTTIRIKHAHQSPSATQTPCSTAYYIHEKGFSIGKDTEDSSVFSSSEVVEIDGPVLHDSGHIQSKILMESQNSSSFQDFIDIHGTDQTNRPSSSDHQVLDASFNSGIVWDSLTLNSSILVCKFSNSCHPHYSSSSQTSSLYLAMGCENGTIIISEIRDEVYRISSENMTSKNNSPQRSTLGTNSRKIQIIAKLQQDSRIRTLDFSPCGSYLLAAGDDCLICIYSISSDSTNQSVTDGEVNPTISVVKIVETEREDRIYSTAWAPLGSSLFAVGGFDGKLAIYSFKDKPSMAHLLFEIPCNCLILSVTWSPDSSALAIGGSNKTVSIFEVNDELKDDAGDHVVESKRLTKISEIPRLSTITCLQWRFDGAYLAIATQDGSLVIYSIASDNQRLKEIYRSKKDETTLTGTRVIHTLCFSPDGLFLALSCDSKCVLLEMESYTVVQEIKRMSIVKSVDWVYWPFTLDSGPSKCILAVTDDCTVALLKTGTDDDGSTQYSLDSSDYDSTDGSSISSAHSTRSTDWFLDETSFIEQLSETETTKVPNERTNNVSFVTFSQGYPHMECSSFLAVAYGDGTLLIVSTDDWRVIKALVLSQPLKAVLWSFDNEFLVVHITSEISLVSTQTWEKIHEVTRTSEAMSCCWNPGSNRLLIGSSDGIVTIIGKQEETFITLGELDGMDSSVNCLSWSHDDKYIAICREDASFTVYNSIDICENFFLTQSEPLSCVLEHPAHFLQFTSNSEMIIIASRTISLYSIADKGTPLRQFECVSPLVCISLSSRDYLAVSGAGIKGSNIITVYHCFNEEKPFEVKIANEQCDTVTSVSFNVHGDLMAASAYDGLITIYDCETWTAILSLPALNSSISIIDS